MYLWRNWNATTVTWSALKSDWYCQPRAAEANSLNSIKFLLINGLGTRLIQLGTVVEVASGIDDASGRASHAWHERYSNAGNCQAHELIVKLSPCMCSYIGCPSWRNGWHISLASQPYFSYFPLAPPTENKKNAAGSQDYWHMWYLATDLGWAISYLKFGYKVSDKSCYIP